MSTRRKLGTAVAGAVLVLVLFAAYELLVSSEMFPRGGDPGERRASPLPETASISDAPPVAESVPATRPGSDAEARRTGGPEPTSTRGPLLVPVAGVWPEQLVDTYTQARSEGRRHDAIDIAAPRGTPVLATAEGTVLKLFRSEQGGITLYQLDPDRRTIYYYAHLDRYGPAIAEGMRLRQGDTIGYVGNTGNAGVGNYHLHFEITTTDDPQQYWGGTPANPYPLLRGDRSSADGP